MMNRFTVLQLKLLDITFNLRYQQANTMFVSDDLSKKMYISYSVAFLKISQYSIYVS